MVMELEGLRHNGIEVGMYFVSTKLLEDSLIMYFEKRLMTKSSSSTRETIQKMMKHHENHEHMWYAQCNSKCFNLPNQRHLIQLIRLSVDAPVIYNDYVRNRDKLNVIRFGKH